jgi:hypothetical protein
MARSRLFVGGGFFIKYLVRARGRWRTEMSLNGEMGEAPPTFHSTYLQNIGYFLGAIAPFGVVLSGLEVVVWCVYMDTIYTQYTQPPRGSPKLWGMPPSGPQPKIGHFL